MNARQIKYNRVNRATEFKFLFHSNLESLSQSQSGNFLSIYPEPKLNNNEKTKH